jgi:hypothetical protein
VHFLIEDGVIIRAQLLPSGHSLIPLLAVRGVRAALQIRERGFVRRDEPGARAGFDGHVADGHPRFHRQPLDGAAAVLKDVALAAAGADLGDDSEDDVLGRDTWAQRAVDVDRHRLERPQRKRLGGQNVLDLGRADAERHRTERAVRGSVTVAADHGHSRLGQAELRADDMHDALLVVAHLVERDAELGAVAAKRLDLDAGDRIGDRQLDVDRRHIVILGRHSEIGAADRAAGLTQAVERLRAGHFVHEVQVDVEEIRLVAVASTYYV